MRFAAVCFALAVLTLQAGCQTAKIEDFSWRRLTTEHFTLISNAPAGESVELAQALERFRSLVLKVSGATLVPETIPTKIYLFTDWGSYYRYTAGTSMLGFNYPTLRANYIVISPGVYTADPKRIIFHEYVHYLLRHQRVRFPTWYDEGFAEFMSDVRIDDGRVLVGNIPREGINAYASLWRVPLKRVMGSDYVLDWAPSEIASFYAESWATVHYLLSGESIGEPEQTENLRTYLQLLNEGTERDAAFAAAFGADYAEIAGKVRHFIKRRRLPGIDIAEDEVQFNAHVHQELLAPYQVASDLGELTLLQGDIKAALAQSLFERTLQVEPANSPARSGLAMALAEQSQYSEAIVQARKALTDDPSRAGAHIDLAKILFGICGSEAPSPEPGCVEMLHVARDQFAQSVALEPTAPEAHAGFGLTLSRLHENPQNAIEHLNTAHDMSQWMPQLNMELAKLYLRSGNSALARQSLTQVVRWAKSQTLRREAEALLAQLQTPPFIDKQSN